MRIIAVRHTSVSVKRGTCYGHSDVSTTATFNKEAAAIVEKLGHEPIVAIFTSPLLRCRKLAGAVAMGRQVIYDNRLKELNFGEWEGRYWADIGRTDEGKAWFDDWVNTPCPGGESYRQLSERVRAFVIEVTRTQGTVLVITHAGPIRAMKSIIEGTPLDSSFKSDIGYGSVVIFDNVEVRE